MLLKVAWRNIWRNTLRSMVVIFSIILGIWAGLFVVAMTLGLNNQRTQGFIKSSIAHIQIHNPNFLLERNLNNAINEITTLETYLEKNKEIKANTLRTLDNGMAATATASGGVIINGIVPEKESTVTNINTLITEGDYFKDKKKNRLVIGEKLAKKLNARTGSRIILTFQDKEANIINAAFKVCGIYKTLNSVYDESNIFVREQDLFGLMGTEPAFQEVALLVNNPDSINYVKRTLKEKFPQLTVQSWDEIAPELGYANEIMGKFIYIFMGIILFALAFGIINTMLMAVLERKHELGMLMAVGMNKMKVFKMIVYETVLLSLTGGPLGVLLAWLTITYYKVRGIDLAMVSKGLESVGIGRFIYPSLDSELYFTIGLMIILTAIISSIYPALKALKLNPSEAIRSL